MGVDMRVGIGYDIHRLVTDRRLVLGGVEIDHRKGLLGHSDGDVVLHAVIDAMLGAAGMGDIGELFPDTNPQYRDADSREFLTNVVKRVRDAGHRVGNIDIIIHAERPNLSDHKKRIAACIAELVGVSASDVNVKAKTNEGLGPVGTRDGIACTAIVALLSD